MESNHKQDEEQQQRIARRAFEKYEARGGEHGLDMDDWLEAEAELRDPGGESNETPTSSEMSSGATSAPTLDVGPSVPVDAGQSGERAGDVMVDVPAGEEQRGSQDLGTPGQQT